MAYYPYKLDKPDPTEVSDGMGDMQDFIRKNTNAIRDSLLMGSGMVPGWDLELQDLDGTPATDPSLPEQIMYDRTYASTTYYVRVRITYYSSGVPEDLPETIITHFQVGAGGWDLVADTDYPLGTLTLTYDGTTAEFRSGAWS